LSGKRDTRTIDHYCRNIIARNTLPYPTLLHGTLPWNDNALTSQCKFFLSTTKNRRADPSEICALEFKGKFRRFGICSVSGTIGIDRSIFRRRLRHTVIRSSVKNTVTLSYHSRRQQRATTPGYCALEAYMQEGPRLVTA